MNDSKDLVECQTLERKLFEPSSNESKMGIEMLRLMKSKIIFSSSESENKSTPSFKKKLKYYTSNNDNNSNYSFKMAFN